MATNSFLYVTTHPDSLYLSSTEERKLLLSQVVAHAPPIPGLPLPSPLPSLLSSIRPGPRCGPLGTGTARRGRFHLVPAGPIRPAGPRTHHLGARSAPSELPPPTPTPAPEAALDPRAPTAPAESHTPRTLTRAW